MSKFHASRSSRTPVNTRKSTETGKFEWTPSSGFDGCLGELSVSQNHPNIRLIHLPEIDNKFQHP